MAMYQGGQRNFSVLGGPVGSVRIIPRQLNPWGPERRGIVNRNFGWDPLWTMLSQGTDIAGIANRLLGPARQVTRRPLGRRSNPDWGSEPGGGGLGSDRVGFGERDPDRRGSGRETSGHDQEGRSFDPVATTIATFSAFSSASPSNPAPVSASSGLTPGATFAATGAAPSNPSVADRIQRILPNLQQGVLGTTVAQQGTSPLLRILVLAGIVAVGWWVYVKYIRKGHSS